MSQEADNEGACLRAQHEDIIRATALEISASLEYVDLIRMKKSHEVSYETLQRSGFKRKEGWQRKYTLADARRHADTAAIRLRNAWELLDPISPSRQKEAQRTALANCQDALQELASLRERVAELEALLEVARSGGDVSLAQKEMAR